LLWRKSGADVSELKPLSLCADADRVFYQNGKDVVCLELASGREWWSKAVAPLRLAWKGNVVCADNQEAAILSAQNGETRWQAPHKLTEVRDVFIAGGALWVGGFKPAPGKRSPAWGPYFATQLDLATGKLLMHIEPENPSHHHRCYPNKATDRYILGGRRGTEFIDLASGEVLWNSWARGVCKYGIMPCNGLLYAPPHACACYMTAKLIGFNALAPRRPVAQTSTFEPGEVERGPAYAADGRPSSSPLPRGAGRGEGAPSDWPTYRHDAQRSGATASPVPARLQVKWQADIGGKLSAIVVAEGRALAASVDDHRIAALDADSGKLAWQFTAGARVDSPPTVYQGRAIFGCRDGYVYSLRASDGAPAWRARAAREDRRAVVCGQLESVSPASGSVLVQDGAVYVTAGRSSYLDGGIDLCRLDPQTGKTLTRSAIYSPDPLTGKQPPQFTPAAMPGSRQDILSSDRDHIYLQDSVFDKLGKPQSAGNPHLFAMTGFLDDAWAHRSYWIFGTQCSVAGGCSSRAKDLVYGRLLVFDKATVYGYGRAGVHWSNQLQDGPYRLFALNRAEGQSRWEKPLPIQVRAMVLASNLLFVAGPPTSTSVGPWDRSEDQTALLMAISAADGSVLAQTKLDASPVFDGMAAADGRLYVSLENGRVACLEEDRRTAGM
jgi:outer membrane protein assembly factor BamB